MGRKEEYKEKNIPTSQLTDSFRKSFYQAVIHYIIAKEPTLAIFASSFYTGRYLSFTL